MSKNSHQTARLFIKRIYLLVGLAVLGVVAAYFVVPPGLVERNRKQKEIDQGHAEVQTGLDELDRLALMIHVEKLRGRSPASNPRPDLIGELSLNSTGVIESLRVRIEKVSKDDVTRAAGPLIARLNARLKTFMAGPESATALEDLLLVTEQLRSVDQRSRELRRELRAGMSVVSLLENDRLVTGLLSSLLVGIGWAGFHLIRSSHRTMRELGETIAQRDEQARVLQRERDLAENLTGTAPVILLLLDSQGAILHVNPFFEQLTGWRLDELRGRDWFSTFLPERDRERIRGLFLTATGGIPTRGNVNPILTRTGEEREIEWHDQGLRDFPGRGRSLLAVGIDVTERRRAEELSRQQEAEIEAIFRAYPDLNFVLSADGHILNYRTGNIGELYLPPDEFLGKRMQAVLPPAVGAGFQDAINSVNRKSRIEIFEYELAMPSGIKAYEARLAPLSGQRISVMVRDISERKRAEAALRAGEVRTRQILDGLFGFVGLYDLDGTMIDVNEAPLRAAGIQRSEALGIPFWDTYWWNYDEAVQAELKSALRQAAAGETVRYEPRVRVQGGALIDIDVTFGPLRDAAGAVTHLLGFAVDITERKRAEAALHEGSERHKAILRTAMQGFWRVDLQARLLEVNDAYVRMSGYSEAELLAISIPELEALESHAETAAHIKKVMELGEDRFESLHRRKDGSVFPVEISVQYKSSDGGCMIVFVDDITERRQAGAALRESEARYRRAERGTNDGLWEWNILTGEAYHSSRWFGILGYAAGELPQRFDTFRGLIHPDDRARVDEAIDGHLRNRRAFNIEMRLRCKDGNYLWVNSRGEAEHDASGKPVRMSGSITDISERKRADIALRESESHFRVLFQQAAVGMALIDSLTGRFLQVNGKYGEILGYGTEGMLQLDFMSITHPEDLAPDLANMERLKSGEVREFAMEKRLLRKDGTVAWVNLTVSAMWPPGAAPTQHIAVVEDITERKRTEAALRESESRLKEAQHVAHLGSVDWDLATDTLILSQETLAIYGLDPKHERTTLNEVKKLLHPEERKRVGESLRAAAAGTAKHDMEHRIMRPDGTEIYVRATAELIRDSHNRPVRLLGTVQDITERRWAEAALQYERDRLRQILDSQFGLVAVLATDGTVIEINQTPLTFMGLSRADVLERNFLEIGWIELGTRPQARAAIAAAAGGEIVRCDLAANFSRLGRRDVDTIFYPLQDEASQVVNIVVFGVDITERKQAEAGMRASEERFRHVFEAIPCGLVVVDAGGRIAMLNDCLITQFGYSREELLGQPVELLVPVRHLHSHAGTRGTYQQKPQARAMGGARELFGRRKDGGEFPVEIGLQPFEGTDGRMVLAVVTDITERKRAEAALNESEDRLQQAQRIAQVGSWELDIRTNRLHWSAEVFRLFEIDPAQFAASYEAFLNAVHPEDRDRVNQSYSSSLRDRQPYRITHRLQMADGRIKHVEEQCETDFAPDGTPLHSRGTVQDVTERVLAERTISESLREKETLLREIHHRVKNNLQIIAGLLYFQAKKTGDPAILAVFNEARERLRSMMLVHEKLYNSPNLADVDFADYIRSLVDQLTQSFTATGRRVRFRVEADAVLLPIETALPSGMILVELITNIFKYAHPDGRAGEALVRLAVADGRVDLTVADDGVGLPAGFDPETVASFGWQLIRNLTLQLDATISISREGGTRVTVSFPHKHPEQ